MNEMCPRCREVREMEIRKKNTTRMDPDGSTVKIAVASWYCTKCGTFVKSEEQIIGKGI